MSFRKFRNVFISVFVVVWLCVFHYESLRHFYLQPFFSRPLPKVKFLFPPAGWIMFYNVADSAGYVEVYGVRNGVIQPIDPHQIVRTRFIGFDMVRRNVLSAAVNEGAEKGFCAALQRQFPEFEAFMVTRVFYPSLTRSPLERYQQTVYRCPF